MNITHDAQLTKSGTINVRRTTTDKDGKKSHFRYVILPGDDYSSQPEEIQIICKKLFSDSENEERRNLL